MSVFAKEFGYFFNSSNSDRTYSASSFEEWLKPFFKTGVFAGGLQVTAQSTPDMSVNVAAGYANLNGKSARWPSVSTVDIPTASGFYNRIDTVVLRRDDTARTISIEVVEGVASANPVPTAPVRSNDIYELVLAQIYVGVGVTSITNANIIDKRMDSAVCGYVASNIDEIDFDQIKTQFEAWLAQYESEQLGAFETWFQAMKDQLSEDAAGNLQNQIDNKLDNVPNDATHNGYVPATNGAAGKVWMTGSDGAPAWKDVSDTYRGIVDNLTTEDSTSSLSAAQGKALNDKIEGMVYNGLDSEETNKALSALQGKNLNDSINGLVVDNVTTSDATKALSAAQGKALNDMLSNMFVLKNYTCAYKLNARQSKDLTGKAFGMEVPSGYRAVAVLNARTGNDWVQMARVHGSATGTTVAMVITNDTDTARSATAAISVLYCKTSFF